MSEDIAGRKQAAVLDYSMGEYDRTINKIRQNVSLLTVALLLLVFMATSAPGREPEKTMIKGHTMYTLLKPGDIPAIFDPEFVPVPEADEFYYPNEPLLVVVDGNTARGYSTWHLDHHEVVNDFINGKAIAATW